MRIDQTEHLVNKNDENTEVITVLMENGKRGLARVSKTKQTKKVSKALLLKVMQC